MNVIDYNRLRKIVAEEVKSFKRRMSENDEKSMGHSEEEDVLDLYPKISDSAGSLLQAIKNFEEKCPQNACDSVSSQLSSIKNTLRDMAGNPASYASGKKSPSVKGVDNLRSSEDLD